MDQINDVPDGHEYRTFDHVYKAVKRILDSDVQDRNIRQFESSNFTIPGTTAVEKPLKKQRANATREEKTKTQKDEEKAKRKREKKEKK